MGCLLVGIWRYLFDYWSINRSKIELTICSATGTSGPSGPSGATGATGKSLDVPDYALKTLLEALTLSSTAKDKRGLQVRPPPACYLGI
jgi:hypothetical protein